MNLELAIKTALPLVKSKDKHKHYSHVVKLAEKLYRPMITGEKADHLIKQFNLREDPDAYQQRLRLTQLITPAITNTLTSPVRKVPKVKPIVDVLTFGDQAKEKDEKLKEAASVFYSGKSVDHWFASIALDQGMIDPNAWALILFDDFGGRIPKAKPYPSIISSTDAWNFEKWNGQTIWLMAHRDIKYKVKAQPMPGQVPGMQAGKVSPEEVKEEKGHAFWFYSAQYNIVLRQVDPGKVEGPDDRVLEANGKVVTNLASVEVNVEGKYFYRVSQKELYEVSVYKHQAGAVQAFCLGYVPDQRTKGETFVNLWHSAVPFMLKGIKAGSELDISAALHAFLQKLTYREPCTGYTSSTGSHTECNDGMEPSGGANCRACDGTGYQVHKSGQDHISLRMPRSKEDMLPLSELVHYVPLPVDTLKWQDEYVDKLERACYRAVYNSDRFRAEQVSTTATGDIIDLQAVYDAVRPFCDWFSQSRTRTYKLLANYTIGPGAEKSVQIHHELPRNLRFETISERTKLIMDLRAAGVNEASITTVNEDLLNDIYIDDPRGLLKAKTLAAFDPFAGKSEATIVSMISQDLAPLEHKVYWVNRNYIWEDAEERVAARKGKDGEPLNIYDLTREKQWEVIDAIVQELIDRLDKESEAAKLGSEDFDDEGEAKVKDKDDIEMPAKPWIGPEGGKYADAAHTIPWKEKMPDSPGKNATE